MFPKKGNKLHQPGEFNIAIAEALKADLGSTHRAIKTVARWTGTSERTAKYWLAGSHAPRGEHLMALAHNSDAVWKALLLLSGRGHLGLPGQLTDLRKRLTDLIDVIDVQPQN